MNHHLLLPGVHISRKLEAAAEVGPGPRHSDVDSGFPSCVLTAVLNVYPGSWYFKNVVEGDIIFHCGGVITHGTIKLVR